MFCVKIYEKFKKTSQRLENRDNFGTLLRLAGRYGLTSAVSSQLPVGLCFQRANFVTLMPLGFSTITTITRHTEIMIYSNILNERSLIIPNKFLVKH